MSSMTISTADAPLQQQGVAVHEPQRHVVAGAFV